MQKTNQGHPYFFSMAWLRTKQKADCWGSTEQEPDSFPQVGEETLDCLPYTRQVNSKGDKVQTFALRIQVLVPPSAASPPVGSVVPQQESRAAWKAAVAWREVQREKSSPEPRPWKTFEGLTIYKALVLGSALSMEPAQPRAQGDERAGADRCCTHHSFHGPATHKYFLK